MRTVEIVAVWFTCVLIFTGCAVSPDTAYEKASKTDSIAAYRKFVEEYPKSALTPKALDRIQELTNDLFVAGIRQICFSKASGDSLPPWDRILQDDKTNIMALAMKGIAEAKRGNLEGSAASFKECSQKAHDTPLAPYVLFTTVVRDKRMVPLRCPLPASITKNALLNKPNQSQDIEKNQFIYTDPDASPYPIALLPGQGRVFIWKVPSGSTVDIIRKIMDENIRSLSGT